VTSHHLPVKIPAHRDGPRVVHIDLPEAREPLPDLLFGKMPMPNTARTDTLVECDLHFPGSLKTATFGCPTAADPRVIELSFHRHQLVTRSWQAGLRQVQTIESGACWRGDDRPVVITSATQACESVSLV
jgi:hypothetical protein